MTKTKYKPVSCELEISEEPALTSHNLKYLGHGVGFERIRRITGYLVGTLDRFNNAKRHEEKDRVKHSFERKFRQ